jgi:toxin YoeB
MAKEVVWSLRALKERKDILDYWRLRNKSTSYSKKLNQLFKESVKIITDFPQIGKPTDDLNTRIKIVRDY